MLCYFTAQLTLLQLVSIAFAAQKVLKNGPVGPLDAKFAQLVNETLHLWHVPGLAIAVIDGDDVQAEV